jgi:hypothetical protein
MSFMIFMVQIESNDIKALTNLSTFDAGRSSPSNEMNFYMRLPWDRTPRPLTITFT